MKQIRKRLTYANVMSSLAVFFVLGGGVAFAALGKNTVGTPQLKKNAVKTNKIGRNVVKVGKLAPEAVRAGKLAKNAVPTNRLRDDAVATAKLGGDAVTTEKIAPDAVTGDKVKESSLSEVPSAANAQKLGGKSVNDVAMWAFVSNNGTLTRSSGGVTSEQLGTGSYKVTFPRAVNTCAYNATNAANDNVVPETGQVAVALATGGTNAVRVETDNSEGAATNDQFMLVVTC
ncbi:MAG: hypothetical protein FVQ78_10985 [Solirubrobacterales bacterium]|nr:hypothetical protein [Solirubrobacterales bacterium]